MAKLSKRKDTGRYFAEFREYADVIRPGDHIKVRMSLVPDGSKVATTDPVAAQLLFTRYLTELEERRQNKERGHNGQKESLGRFATRHLELKAQAKGKDAVTDSWLIQAEKHLTEACDFFGLHTDLATLTPDDMDRWVAHLRQQDNGRGGTLSESSVRKYLNSVSNLFKRAKHEKLVAANPVADMYSKPTPEPDEAPFLEPAEAALLLESARTYRPDAAKRPQGHGGAIVADAYPHMYPLLATFLLTGGRKSEVLGLEVDDVSLRHDKVYFRPNDWRRLKTKKSKRAIPLWPQLKDILSSYLMEREQEGGLGSLLFPSHRGGKEKMIQDLRKALNRIGTRAGFPEGHVRLHMLRHTYTAARIQTCDRGRPVALYTVARELGWSSTDMLEDRYAHLHDRAEAGGTEVVEFRVEHHRAQLGDRLAAIRPES